MTFKITFSDKEGARRAPCFDVCMDYEHSKLREENILKEGAAIKQRYLELGGEHIGDGVIVMILENLVAIPSNCVFS